MTPTPDHPTHQHIPPEPSKSSDVTKPHETVHSAPHENLINQAKENNAKLEQEKLRERVHEVTQVNVKEVSPVVLNAIKDVLKDGGMDSMQQAKAYARIVEILGWDRV